MNNGTFHTRLGAQLCSILLALVFVCTSFGQTKQAKIAILGDSITYAGDWAHTVELALKSDKKYATAEVVNFGLPSETVSGKSEEGHAGGRFPRPCLHERLGRITQEFHPTLILACYGMNDGNMKPFSQEYLDAYAQGMEKLKAAADAIKSPIIFITPPLFGADNEKQADYDTVLDKFAAWLVAQKAKGWHVIDIRPALRKSIANAKAKDANFKYAGDGVHPGKPGHAMLADAIINGLKPILKLAYTTTPPNTPQSFAAHCDTRNAWLTRTKHIRPEIHGYSAELAQVATGAEQAAQQPTTPGIKGEWQGYEREDFTFQGRAASIVYPKKAAPGNPWIWRPQFFEHEPQVDLELISRGFAAVFIKMDDMYGSPKAMEIMDAFYAYLVKERKLAPKAVLIGFSRGGLYSLNWADLHPERVAAVYVDAPVCDFKSWPGGKGKSQGSPGDWQKLLDIYRFTEQQALNYKGNPVDKHANMAKGKVPVLFVSRTEDTVVPIEENTDLFAARYAKAGGSVAVIRHPGNHHPHSLKQPAQIVDFILQATKQPVPVRIACLGDSNTFGAGVGGPNRDTLRWSYLLEQKLATTIPNIKVHNYGISGRTLLSKGDLPYIQTREYKDAIDTKATVAIIALGTNDAKPQNRKFMDEFKQDYTDIIKALRSVNPKIKIYCAIPLPSWGGPNAIDGETVAKTIIPLVKQIAKDNKCETIDFYNPFKDKPTLLPDKIHPNAEGQILMAETVLRAIRKK